MEIVLCELFKDEKENEIEIVVDREDYREFLYFCKSNGVLWNTGEIIHPETDRVRNTSLARISKDLLLSFVGGMRTMQNINERIRYNFSDLKQGIIQDIRMECLKNDEEKERIILEQEELLKQKFDEKLRVNRELSLKELNSSVPKSYYYVKCHSYREILRTVDFLSHRNYKNLYDIYKSDESCVIQVNTLDKQFMLAKESPLKDKLYEINDFINCYLRIYEPNAA